LILEESQPVSERLYKYNQFYKEKLRKKVVASTKGLFKPKITSS